ncbi:MAG: DegT/DnrJ/EryC1/StrS family aminotransferase [Methanomicrobiales archaeon]|nr:DegT/DnrJ/EryC1/StrS family aminotransferase [Methanomicrobiales archaeon]
MEVLDSQFRTSSGGIMTKRLEEEFAKRFHTKYAISFINGTATMHAALAAAGVGLGDEVIVPPLTMASTSFAVIHCGATPVFADIDPDTWTVDPASVEERISPRTKAIIPVALYGLLPDLDPLMDLAGEHGLFVLEDDAQCFLGYYRGRMGGSIGHAASFSFQSSKHLTSGEGGMVTTSDPDLATRIRRVSSLGYAAVEGGAGRGKITKETIQDPNYERHVCIGWNYRMPELCAAVALGQVERIEELVGMRQKVARLYDEVMEECDWLVPQSVPGDRIHSYWSYVARIDGTSVSWHDFRRKFVELGGDGIYAAWKLTYLEPAFRDRLISPHQRQNYSKGLCRNAEAVQPRLLQFKTNYLDLEQAAQIMDALSRTIRDLGG